MREGFIPNTDVMGASSMHVPAWMTGCSFFVVRWCVRPVSPRHLRFSNSGLYTASLGVSFFRKLTGSSVGSAPSSLFMGVLLPNAALVAKRLAGIVVRFDARVRFSRRAFPNHCRMFCGNSAAFTRMMLDWILCFLSPNKVALGRLEAWHSLFS